MRVSKEEAIAFILANGWEAYGKQSYVKTEWINFPGPSESNPNWYRTETLDSAYVIAMKEKEDEDYLLSHGWEKLSNGYVKTKWTHKENPMTLSAAYTMEMTD